MLKFKNREAFCFPAKETRWAFVSYRHMEWLPTGGTHFFCGQEEFE